MRIIFFSFSLAIPNLDLEYAAVCYGWSYEHQLLYVFFSSRAFVACGATYFGLLVMPFCLYLVFMDFSVSFYQCQLSLPTANVPVSNKI